MATYTIVDWLYFSGARGVDGNPVSSGSVSFYNPGSTSVAVPVFADSTGTPLAQPVALDAAGRATVYVNSPCEIIVKDAFGATVRTASNSIAVIGDQVAVSWDSTTKTLSQALEEIATFMAAQPVDAANEGLPTLETISTQNPVFTMNVDITINLFYASYPAASDTATVNLPSPVTLTVGRKYRIIVQANQVGGGGTSITSLVMGTGIQAQATPTPILTLSKVSGEFIALTASTLTQVTPWVVVIG
jgi:hypothetical protein